MIFLGGFARKETELRSIGFEVPECDDDEAC